MTDIHLSNNEIAPQAISDPTKALIEEGRGEIENISEDKEMRYEIAKLQNVFEVAFYGALKGGSFTGGEESLAGDAASLFALVEVPTSSGEETALAKIGWGEFSESTFKGGKYPAFTESGFEIYCVPQWESYFADEDLQEKMKEDPAGYLKDKGVFRVKNGQLEITGFKDQFKDKPTAIPYDKAIKMARNTAVRAKSSPGEFADFLTNLPDDENKLADFIAKYAHMPFLSRKERKSVSVDMLRDQQIKDLVELLPYMGIETLGIFAGDKKAMRSILELKRQFNFETKQF
jgi:hypothetical protein